MNIQLSKLALAALIPAIILCGWSGSAAQSRPAVGKQKTVRTNKPKTSPRPASEGPAKQLLSPQPAPVEIVNLAEPDYLSGEASVTVNPKQPTVIRLGLAQNAVSIIEFPASDGIYYIHEGNPRFASVFHSPTKETDRSITVYPGESFLPSRDGATAAAISLQMRSGLVLILEFVPVADVRKNAHRCVITYDREAVISARRTAGLAYDFGGENPAAPTLSSRAVSKLVGPSPVPENEKVPETLASVEHPIQSAYANLNRAGGTKEKRGRKMSESEISSFANRKLAEAIRDPKKNLGVWSMPQQGLELAVSRITELDSETRLVVVAIRNVTASNLRLIPGSPELQVQTVDAGGNSIQTTPLDARYIESTTLEGLVQPGSTVYYAIVYKAPILGTNQNVRVLVAHREAADAPLSSSLSDLKTKE
ncbi:MAG TPA: hypothetical protein PKD24_16990 [Pyrinomonadaceae bacterium]|nr:hypothetical protein [Pyrinomonadaceae bacterium]HMP67093.1 hypothetical protein [Pyrinomonadaceae bacterium]